ncbi:MAG: uracil-DNA glycosylase [Methanoregulaceae archaeon]|nr:uracil-DNA glycosylase [Methanoregulaceae archaeon]
MKHDAVRKLSHDITTCTRCRLSLTRINAVPGEGPVPSRLFFIGEAPGKKEDLTGRPFVGRAGSVLEALLASVGLERNKVYITSIIKCRPPENRLPRRDEIAACSGYLDQQIEILYPEIIIPMGRLASELIFSHFGLSHGPIGRIHGKAFHAKTLHRDLLIVPVYHPAAVTHNPPIKSALFEDFQILGTIIEEYGRSFRHE